MFAVAERTNASGHYRQVDEVTAGGIHEGASRELENILSRLLPATASPQVKDNVRSGWLHTNYLKVVACMLKERDNTDN